MEQVACSSRSVRWEALEDVLLVEMQKDLEPFETEYGLEDSFVAAAVVADSVDAVDAAVAVVGHATNAKPREVVRLLIDSA